jgi:ATP-dependent protease ClpP protease subunit
MNIINHKKSKTLFDLDSESISSKTSNFSSNSGKSFFGLRFGGIKRDNNHIYFYSEVDRSSIQHLIELLMEAESYCIEMKNSLRIKKIPIYLHINSFGGCIFSAFNAIDYMETCSVPIYTVVEGSTASAGTLISVCGRKRYIRKNAYMLIHQLSSECWGKMAEIEDSYKNLKGLMSKIRNHYKEYTAIPKDELKVMLKHDLWMNSDKCLEYGIVDDFFE